MLDHEGTGTPLRPITEVARDLRIAPDHLETYGRDKAKVRLDALHEAEAVRPPGKLILVSAITPTPAGEGKTTTSIGLSQGLHRIGKTRHCAFASRRWGRSSAARGAPPAAERAGSSRRTRSTSSSPAISTRSRPPITCWPPRSITGSISATSTSTRPGWPGNACST